MTEPIAQALLPLRWVTRSDIPADQIPVTDEFCGGVTDACGPASNANLRAAMERRTPGCGDVLEIRTRDIAAGMYGHGQTLSQVWWDLQNYGYQYHALMWPYKPNLAVYTHDEIVRLLWSVGRSDFGGVIIEVANATALPFNEQGVKVHYVAALGYDRATDRALIANPDRVPIPHGTGHADWLSVASVAGASVIGMILVRPPV